MHKLLTFTRRRGEFKKMKDLYYVAFVSSLAYSSIAQLAVDIQALDIANGWRRTAADNIATVVANLDAWKVAIKDNDPEGFLTSARVVAVYRELAQLYGFTRPPLSPPAVKGQCAKHKEQSPLEPARICADCGKFFRVKGTLTGDEAKDERCLHRLRWQHRI